MESQRLHLVVCLLHVIMLHIITDTAKNGFKPREQHPCFVWIIPDLMRLSLAAGNPPADNPLLEAV